VANLEVFKRPAIRTKAHNSQFRLAQLPWLLFPNPLPSVYSRLVSWVLLLVVGREVSPDSVPHSARIHSDYPNGLNG
jgi:hypothetical protein